MRARLWMQEHFCASAFEEIHEREVWRAVLRHELETHRPTLAQLGHEIGVSAGTLRAFLAGGLPQTDARMALREWTEDRPHYRDRSGLTIAGGTVALTAAAECFPAGQWRVERNIIAWRLATVYRERGEPVPGWIDETR